jgi:hypothetical protein
LWLVVYFHPIFGAKAAQSGLKNVKKGQNHGSISKKGVI